MPTATAVNCAYLTLTSVRGARAGVCEDSVRNWIKKGRLKPYRLLNRTVVLDSDLDELLAADAPGADTPRIRAEL